MDNKAVNIGEEVGGCLLTLKKILTSGGMA